MLSLGKANANIKLKVKLVIQVLIGVPDNVLYMALHNSITGMKYVRDIRWDIKDKCAKRAMERQWSYRIDKVKGHILVQKEGKILKQGLIVV